jgi:hypothetical protein
MHSPWFMREQFYGLLKEYLSTLRELTVHEEQAQAAAEGIEREEASRKVALIKKRCRILRLEIKGYPDIGSLSHRPVPNDSTRRYIAQAS